MSGPNDTSVWVERPREMPDLQFSDYQLRLMTRPHCEHTAEVVPGLRYWAMDEHRKMSRPDNVCGNQQRAFEFYWCLRALEMGRPALSVGAGAIGASNSLTTHKYCGRPPENDGGRYGAGYGFSCMEIDADEMWPFHDKQFGAVFFNHSFEHLNEQGRALREALRVLVPGGYACVLQPDMTFMRRGDIDPTHTTEWAADAFWQYLREMRREAGGFDVHAHNTLDNDFSFDTVLVRA